MYILTVGLSGKIFYIFILIWTLLDHLHRVKHTQQSSYIILVIIKCGLKFELASLERKVFVHWSA